MRKRYLPYAPSVRLLWALGGIAFLLAASPGVALFVPLALVASALLALALIVDLARGPARAEIVVERQLPPHVALRSRAEIAYRVRNESGREVRVGIAEAPRRTLRFDEAECVVVAPARSAISARATALPVERGTDAFDALYVWWESTGLGLVRRRAIVEMPATFRVYPDLSAVERYGSLHARNRLIEAGLRRMRMRGEGTEFESLRDYADGDAFRTVDWKASARRGKLMVMQREVERSQDVMLLVDCGRLMNPRIGDQRKLDYAITAALSLASIASLASDRVGVVAFAQRILVARAPRSTAASTRALADALCDVAPYFEESDYARAFRYVGSHLHRRSLVVLFTDVIDPVAQGVVLAELRSLTRRHVVLCVFMNDAAVASTLAAQPTSVDDAYRLDVALGLLSERAIAKRTLERAGALVLDVPAARLSTAAIDEYLRIKSRALL
ncbi:MAG: DUF58 domain-containing protein [bacterium]|nr:DUF58 domain-containing protein [bacterium]